VALLKASADFSSKAAYTRYDVNFVHHKFAAKKDVVFCGDGRDQVLADRADMLAPDCERVVIVHGSPEDIERQEALFNDSIQGFYRGIRFSGL
jgi:hypothetical protein